MKTTHFLSYIYDIIILYNLDCVKFFLHVLGGSASPEVQSGAREVERGLSSAQQSYDTDEDLWPVSEPREKVEAKWQTSGEIQYTGDIPLKQGELHGAFVLSSKANCDIISMDPSEALVSITPTPPLSLLKALIDAGDGRGGGLRHGR